MKRKTKILISALSAMLVMVLAVTIVSFSFAGNNDEAEISDEPILYAAGDTLTIIDRIILNSIDGEEKEYKIVEIGSTASPDYTTLADGTKVSYMGALANGSESDFKKYVIDSHKSDADDVIDKVMAADTVKYTYYYVADITEEDLEDISSADLIYVSNDPKNPYEAGSKDFSEELYSAILHTYTSNKKKPLIIDSPIDTAEIGGSEINTVPMSKLAHDVFAPKGSRYYTFAWNQSKQNAEQFFKHQEGSLYLGINGTRKSANWLNLILDADSSHRFNTSKMLVISPNPSVDSDTMITQSNFPMAYDLLGLTSGDLLIGATDDEGNSYSVYGIATKKMHDYGYNAKYAPDIPNAMLVDTYQLKANDTELVNVDFDQYDMIVIEDGLENVQITPELYRKFSAAMIGNVSIVYNSKMDTGSGSGSGSGSFDPTASNYNKLFSMIASSKGESLMSNVMVTNRDDFGIIALSKSAATCKTIADLINRSAFRTFGGANSSGNTFTVLEIQPCYPIDRELAAELGKNDATKRNSVRGSKIYEKYGYDNYYTVPANVVNNATKEQVPEGQEYYAWEVSDAKIIDAIGDMANVDASNINIVHMSSEELAASTTAILGTYDMIYIGGNISAKKTAEEYQGIDGVVGWTSVTQAFRDITKMPIYKTYSHNGEMTAVNLATTGESGGPISGGKSFAAEVTPYAGASDVFAVLNGNDVTYNKAQELIAYVESGMPVIVSDDAATAYKALIDAEAATGSEYLQNSLDPDSNMRDVLEACYKVQVEKGNAGNVLWDFDKDATYTRDNDGGRLGSTLTGYVRVYAQEKSGEDFSIEGTDETDPNKKPSLNPDGSVSGDKDQLRTLYLQSIKRPKIEATKLPKLYDDTQKDSSLKKDANGEYKLEFEYEVSGTSGDYTVMFYIDDDGNGRYTTSTGDIYQEFGKNSGTYTLPESYFGAFAWKLEVIDNQTMAMSSITGVSKIDMPADEKKTVRVLQIMPGEGDNPAGEGSMGYNSLYFCTTCQQACMRLDYNPTANTGSLFDLYYKGSYVYNDDRKNNEIANGASAGKHEHTFGIVKYDSTIDDAWISGASGWTGQPGADDWHYNLADEISDMYDFQLDILTRGEVEAISDEVRAAYNVSDAERDAKIANFDAKVAASTEFDDYKALTDPDEKIVYIIQYEAEVEASDNWSKYIAMRDESDRDETTGAPLIKPSTDPITGNVVNTMTTYDAKAELDGAIDELIVNLKNNPNTNIGGMTCPEIAEVLQQIKDEEKYFNYFNIVHGGQNVGIYHDNEVGRFLTSSERSGKTYLTYYKDYVAAKDLELSYLEMYKKYDRIAHADNWLKGCYDTVILGPSEDFAGDDFTAGSNGLRDLANYTKDGGNLLMFHDTFTRFSNAGSSNLTAALRPYVGMDKNHQEADTAKMSANTYYLPYKTAEGYDEDKYFIMNLSSRNDPVASRDTAWYESWTQEMNAAAPQSMNFPKSYLTSVAYTDSVLSADKSFNIFASPYRFAELSWSYAAHWANQSDSDARADMKKGYGTDRATRNNQGLVTLYPFSLSEKIYVSGTHAQSYALDLEDDSTTVWYSLAGGYNKQEGSSMYAASPNDGMDNYFIYSYKNVYYCGAGHSKVTGIGKNNNDERKLYINIICNSVKPSASQPSIHIYDYEKDTYGDKVKQQGGSYYITVDTTDEYPEFSFKVNTDQDAALKTVRIFFDLDYSDTNRLNTYAPDEYHLLIGQWNAPDVKAGVRFDVGRYINGLMPLTNADLTQVMDTIGVDENGNPILRPATRLKLRPEYFDPYNGEYTYIVIEAEDTNGNKVYQRIKIRLKDYLFNLT